MKRLSNGELVRVCGGFSNNGSSSLLNPTDQPVCPVALPPALF